MPATKLAAQPAKTPKESTAKKAAVKAHNTEVFQRGRKLLTEGEPPAAPAVVPQPAPERARLIRPYLTGVQERLADLMGDLIVSGGTDANVNILIEIALDHEHRRAFSDVGDVEELASKHVEKNRQGRADDLAGARATRRDLPEEARPEPRTASERIREQAIDRLEYLAEDFAVNGDPEEISTQFHPGNRDEQ